MAHLTQDSTFTLGRRLAGLIYADKAKSFGGYTLFAPQTAEGRVYLVDEQGEVAHQWQLPVRAGRDAVLLPNGNLGYNGSHRTSANLYPAWDLWHGGDFYEVTPDNEIVWHYEDIYHHHDAQWLANGNLLYTAASPLPADIPPVLPAATRAAMRRTASFRATSSKRSIATVKWSGNGAPGSI